MYHSVIIVEKNAWDESELSKEELKYYLDTQNYVSKKLLEATK